MRKARKEGRFMGAAPMGYRNTRDDKNTPIVTPDDKAPFVRLAFEEMSTGNFTKEEVRKQLNSRGVACSKNNFNKIIRNPFYAGRLFVPSFKDETECFVKAAHEPIISEMLFYKVQDVIKGSRPLNTTKNTCRVEFPLRGFLQRCKCKKLQREVPA